MAFAGEGPTDHAFIAPLVARQAEALVLERSEEVVQIGPIVPVLPDGRRTNQAELLAKEFASGVVYADLLFVHTDAGSSPSRARSERVQPVKDALDDVLEGPRVVGVIPARETEAWMLADLPALGRVLGLREGILSAPQPPSRVHKILDPKATLRELANQVDETSSRRSRTRRHGNRLDRLYTGLASEVDLGVLSRIPSFRMFVTELGEALTEIGLNDGD